MTKTRKNNKNNGNKEFAIFVIIIALICVLIALIPTNNNNCSYSKCNCGNYDKAYHCDIHGHECLN